MRGYYFPLVAGIALIASTFLPWVVVGDTTLRGIPNVPALWVAGLGVIAVALAADTDRLQSLRTGLRDQIRASPLGQTRQFAQDFYDLVASTVAADAGTPPLSSIILPS